MQEGRCDEAGDLSRGGRNPDRRRRRGRRPAVRPCRRRRARRRPRRPLRIDAGPHRRRRRRARARAIAPHETRRRGRLVDGFCNGGIARARARAAPDARRDVVRPAHPPVRARRAGDFCASLRRPRRVQRRHERATRGPAGGLPQAADLLHHQPVHCRRTWRRGEMAALQRGDGLRARDRRRHSPHAREHSRQRGRRAHLRLHDLQ